MAGFTSHTSVFTALFLTLHSLSVSARAAAFVESASLFKSKSFRPATIMKSTQPNDVTLPNWQVISLDDNHNLPPFSHCHSNIVKAAPWSHEAYQSSLDLHARLTSCADPYIAPVLTSALHDLEMAYRLYGPYCMVGSYNGGKDACVIFHLMRAVHAKFCSDMLEKQSGELDGQGIMIPRPRVIYFQHPDEFPSVTSLLSDTVKKYDVEMLAFENGVSFPRGLTYLVENNYPPGNTGQYPTHRYDDRSDTPSHPLAFILGTRSDDPNAGSQGIYAPSSHYMPPFLRVNPILNWTYGHVWHFLRIFNLEYCSLYDDGYTSLGTVKDTIPCPALKKEDGGYFPAYMLRDWSLERAGRLDKKKKEQEESNANNNQEVDVSKYQVTLSQTSSTVSLPDASAKQSTEGIREKSMSDLINYNEIPTESTVDEATIPLSPTVALIVIGDELLKGLTSDANVLSASRALRSYNVSLERVSIISDDLQTIANEIKRIRKEVDVVITSGGVGPTHDDVTVRSVAEACGSEMELNLDMAKLLIEKMGDSDVSGQSSAEDFFATLPEGMRKMASIPAGATLKYLSDNSQNDEWPVLQCNNIFVLPGIPNHFQHQIEQLASYLSSPLTMTEILSKNTGANEMDVLLKRSLSSSPLPRSDIYRIILSTEENTIVSELNATVQANPHVSFGSYPLVDHPKYKTIITVEGRFYNGGYTKGSERLLGRALSNCSDTANDLTGQALYFSKDEIERNIKIALEDLISRLPPESIIKVDTNDHLFVDQT